ncbi:hypothetical protein [Campylobacter lari]|uniref:hypothetical protein n=1 Tax=Campylobacter lari TaxID=201 RepID=UPI003990B661
MNKALAIKSYSEVPVDVSAFANYTCNGYELTYQPINLGDYAIPNTDKVKSVTIKWKGAVDDNFGITIHDTFVDGRIFPYEWIDDWYQGNVKVKWNKVNKIIIRVDYKLKKFGKTNAVITLGKVEEDNKKQQELVKIR